MNEWIVGEDVFWGKPKKNKVNQYLIHTKKPRFICVLDYLNYEELGFIYKNKKNFVTKIKNEYYVVMKDFEWVDKTPDNLDSVLKEARKAIKQAQEIIRFSNNIHNIWCELQNIKENSNNPKSDNIKILQRIHDKLIKGDLE